MSTKRVIEVGGPDFLAKVITVTLAGTRVQLHDNWSCREVLIVALKGNTGHIYVGGSDVSSSVYGADLEAGESIKIPIDNVNLIYIDSSVDGEGVSIMGIGGGV